MLTPSWHIEPDPSGFKVVYTNGPPEGGWNPQAGRSLEQIIEEPTKVPPPIPH